MKDNNPCIPYQLASPTACLLPDLDLASTPQQYTRRAYATHKKCLYTYGEGSRMGEFVYKESLNSEKLHEPGLHGTGENLYLLSGSVVLPTSLQIYICMMMMMMIMKS